MLKKQFNRKEVRELMEDFRLGLIQNLEEPGGEDCPKFVIQLIRETKYPAGYTGEKQKKVSPGAPDLTAYPFKSTLFLEWWKEFEEMRKKKRCLLTEKARKRIFNDLSQQTESNAIIMIKQSCDNGWTGIFGPREDRRGVTQLPNSKQQTSYKGKF